MLKPSSVFRTSMSSQSEGNVAQSGFARLTRSPVTCVASATVSRFVGVGWNACVFASAVAGKTRTSAATARARRRVAMRKYLPDGGRSCRGRRYSRLDSRVNVDRYDRRVERAVHDRGG